MQVQIIELWVEIILFLYTWAHRGMQVLALSLCLDPWSSSLLDPGFGEVEAKRPALGSGSACSGSGSSPDCVESLALV